MPPGKSSKTSKSPKSSAKSKPVKSSSRSRSPTPPPSAGVAGLAAPPASGYLLSCDIPAKQFVIKMNDDKSADKKFIIEDLDETHLLIDGRAREEILKKVEEWMDENVFSNTERVGENLDTS